MAGLSAGLYRGLCTYKSVDLYCLERHILESVRHDFVGRERGIGRVRGGNVVAAGVEEQNDSSAATPRFTSNLSEERGLARKWTSLSWEDHLQCLLTTGSYHHLMYIVLCSNFIGDSRLMTRNGCNYAVQNALVSKTPMLDANATNACNVPSDQERIVLQIIS
jgi:hypothetical protein